MARVNEVLREVLAEEIELVASSDSRLELVTVTAVSCEPDLRHATVLLASLPDAVRDALSEARPRLQAAVAHQVRLKRTPQLAFQADPAVGHGELVEEILRELRSSGDLREAQDEQTGEGHGPDAATGGLPGGPERGAEGPSRAESGAEGPDGAGLGAEGAPGSAEPAA
jgi:ribosome-binding factor A